MRAVCSRVRDCILMRDSRASRNTLQVLDGDSLRRSRILSQTDPELGVRVLLSRLRDRIAGRIIADVAAGPLGSQILRIYHSGYDQPLQLRRTAVAVK